MRTTLPASDRVPEIDARSRGRPGKAAVHVTGKLAERLGTGLISASSLPFTVFSGFTAAQSLSLSTDGPIDPSLNSLVHAFDVAAAKAAPRHGRIGKVTLKPAAIVRIMMTAMEKAVVRCGTVHRADFRQLGLKDCEIDRHFQEAFLKASQRHPSLFLSEAA